VLLSVPLRSFSFLLHYQNTFHLPPSLGRPLSLYHTSKTHTFSLCHTQKLPPRLIPSNHRSSKPHQNTPMRFSYLLFLFLTIAAIAYSAPQGGTTDPGTTGTPTTDPTPTDTGDTTPSPTANTGSRFFRAGQALGRLSSKLTSVKDKAKAKLKAGLSSAEAAASRVGHAVVSAAERGAHAVADAAETGADLVVGGAMMLGEGVVAGGKKAVQLGKDAVNAAEDAASDAVDDLRNAKTNFQAGEQAGKAA